MAGAMKVAMCMVVACMLVTAANAAVACNMVTSKIAPCITYVTSKAPTAVPPACCSGISALNGMAQTTPDRQAACRCLQTAAKGFGPSVDPSRAAGLPAACKVNIPYPISLSTNCDTVH